MKKEANLNTVKLAKMREGDQENVVECQRLVIGISGASGVVMGIRMLEMLQEIDELETHLIISQAAKIMIAQETEWEIGDVSALADVNHNNQDIGASIASGSFQTIGMIVIPCSIKTLSAIANSFTSDLLSRAADVTLKEGRPLILVVRETPLHRGHIRLMDQAAEAGAVIFPPVPAFYPRPQTIDALVDNFVGRVLARIGIENDNYLHWSGIGK
jgi:4-hydroxy-3-polyprenylbenzoate decarboxylase